MVRVVRLERTVSWSQTRRDTNFAIPGYLISAIISRWGRKSKIFLSVVIPVVKAAFVPFSATGKNLLSPVSQGFAAFRPAPSRIPPRHSQSKRATNCANPGYSAFNKKFSCTLFLFYRNLVESQAKIAGDDIDDEDYECSKGERRYHHRQAKLNVIITGTAANNYELNIITLKNADGNLFLRVGDLSLVENERFTVCENAFVHVVHIHLTHRRSILNDLSRLNVLDVSEPPVFL